MAKFDSNLQLHAIVVGSTADEFVRHTMDLLGENSVKFVLCRDVYSAAGQLAKNQSREVLIIGRLSQLSREQGRFFNIACENGHTCCCLADGDLAQRRKQILAAMKTGSFVINEPAELGEILMKLLTDSSACSSEENENNRASAFIKDEFLTTKAELDALLGAGPQPV